MSNGHDFENWKARKDEFQGFVKAKLQDQDKVLTEIKDIVSSSITRNDEKFTEVDKRIDKVEQDLAHIKGKIAIIVAGISTAITFIGSWVINIFKK